MKVGNRVMLNQNSEVIFFIYAHLSQISVKQGD